MPAIKGSSFRDEDGKRIVELLVQTHTGRCDGQEASLLTAQPGPTSSCAPGEGRPVCTEPRPPAALPRPGSRWPLRDLAGRAGLGPQARNSSRRKPGQAGTHPKQCHPEASLPGVTRKARMGVARRAESFPSEEPRDQELFWGHKRQRDRPAHSPALPSANGGTTGCLQPTRGHAHTQPPEEPRESGVRVSQMFSKQPVLQEWMPFSEKPGMSGATSRVTRPTRSDSSKVSGREGGH